MSTTNTNVPVGNSNQGVTAGPATGPMTNASTLTQGSATKPKSGTAPSVTRGANRGVNRIAARGRGGFAGGPGIIEVSTQGEILHEGIPQSKELTHLSELKEVASEHVHKESVGTTSGIQKGGAASLAQSALGKYATAISEETGIPPLSVQGMVPPAEKVDEEKLVKELKEEAQERVAYEVSHMGRVPQAGPARKVEEAAKRLEEVVNMNKSESQTVYTTPPVSPPLSTTAVSKSGAILHEGIEQEMEFQHLSELKEVAEEIGVNPSIVQKMVPKAGYHVDESKLTQEIKDEAQKRSEYEKNKLGFVLPAGPAAKIEEAAEKLMQSLKISEPEVSPTQEHSATVPASTTQSGNATLQ
ncbi:10099_t:CDS:2 [Acaulospora colombiana]|uniref:10099_t:CDS:1 n=1 Tax=Acaulospora colombiana TaxID=27376 RepID=A0ACA9L7D8_9GLOM|nr:10099_t:CDS:2 [Acaulospora colombiana]